MEAPQGQWTFISRPLSRLLWLKAANSNIMERDGHAAKRSSLFFLSEKHLSGKTKLSERKKRSQNTILRQQKHRCRGPLQRPEQLTWFTKRKPHTAPCCSQNVALEESKGWRERAGSASLADPYWAMCSHILHNPAKSCYCKCPFEWDAVNPQIS